MTWPLRGQTLVVIVSLIASSFWTTCSRAQEPAKITYQDHIRPIFQQHCFACHSQDTKKSDLALDAYAATLEGGAGGEVLAAGDLTGSRLWQLVNHDDSPEMPPEQDKLEQAKLDLIKAWIEGGLLENSGSKSKAKQASGLGQVEITADNRPVGEPAMPHGVLRQPLVSSPHPAAVGSLAVSPWAPLAAIPAPRQVALYNTDTGELAGILPYPEGTPQAVRFSRDGSALLVAGGHSAALGNAALFDVKTGARIATVGEEVDAVLAADVSPDLALVAIGGPKKVVRVYRVADGSLAYEIRKHTDWVTAIEFSPDGKYLATADRTGGLFLWDGRAGHERGDFRGHLEQITALSWRADSQAIASACEDDTVRLWQTNGTQIKSIGAHGGGALSVHFAREGQLVTAGRDALVKSWAADGAAVKDIVKFDDVALAARFTHDAKRVLASDWRGRVQLFDAAEGTPGPALAPNPPTLGQRLAAAEARIEPARVALEAAKPQAALAAEQLAKASAAVAAIDALLAETQSTVDALNAARTGAATARVQAADALRTATEKASAAAAVWSAAVKTPAPTPEQAAEAERLKIEWQATEAALASATQQHAAASQAADESAKQFTAAAEQLTQVAAERAQLASVGALQADADAKQSQLAAAQAEFDGAQAAHAAATAELTAFGKAGEQLQVQAADAEQKLAATAEEVASIAATRDQIAAKLAEHEAIAAKLAEELAALKARMDEAAAAKQLVVDEVAEQQKQIDDREATANELRRQATLNAALQAQLAAAAEVRAKYQTSTTAPPQAAK